MYDLRRAKGPAPPDLLTIYVIRSPDQMANRSDFIGGPYTDRHLLMQSLLREFVSLLGNLNGCHSDRSRRYWIGLSSSVMIYSHIHVYGDKTLAVINSYYELYPFS